MNVYADENEGHYPDPNQWCDLLLQHTDVDMDWFLCPAVRFGWSRQVVPWPIPKNERCYYAMNPDCEPNSPDDTMFLFEIAGGWNKFGGPESLSNQNHRGDGCNIVFADGRPNFVGIKEFGELNWDAGEEEQDAVR